MRRALTALFSLLSALPAAAQDRPVVRSSSADDIAITIYRDNLALVTETRTLDLPAGSSTVIFEGVSDLILSQTALVDNFGAITIEKNFEFDPLSKRSLLESAVGEQVLVTRTNLGNGMLTRELATVISAENGVVLESGDGYETLFCAGLPETALFDGVPEDLDARPVLSMDIRAEMAGPQTVELTYLTYGFAWSADYILTKGPDEDGSRLMGWLTFANGTSLNLDKAKTQVVAGSLNRVWEDWEYSYRDFSPAELIEEAQYNSGGDDYYSAACWPKGSTKRGTPVAEGAGDDLIVVTGTRLDKRGFSSNPPPAPEIAQQSSELLMRSEVALATEENLGDYKLYTTPERTTLQPYQQKQIAFLSENNVEDSVIYRIRTNRYSIRNTDARPATIEMRIDNSVDGTLARSLPAGTIRVISPERGLPLFIGDAPIRDLAVGLPVKLPVGEAIDVQGECRLTHTELTREVEDGPWVAEDYTCTVTNAGWEPAEVMVTLEESAANYLAISRNSHPYDVFEAFPSFRATVRPESSVDVTFRVVTDRRDLPIKVDGAIRVYRPDL